MACIASILLVAASHALGQVTFVAESGPWFEILTALAPLDLHVCLNMHPNSNVTRRAQTLVLRRDDSMMAVAASSAVLVRES